MSMDQPNTLEHLDRVPESYVSGQVSEHQGGGSVSEEKRKSNIDVRREGRVARKIIEDVMHLHSDVCDQFSA